MRMISAVCLSLLLFSCLNRNRQTIEIDQLNQRIIRLEKKVDSLISGRNINSAGLNNSNNSVISSYSTPLQSGHCQAITKKGTQCKRKAKANGYCWQHGG